MKTNRGFSTASVLAMIFLISLNFITPMTSSVLSKAGQSSQIQDTIMSLPPGKKNMTFTSDVTLNLTSGEYATFTSGFNMTFTTGIQMLFIDAGGTGAVVPCFTGQVIQGGQPLSCSWWEILDAFGMPTGFEFHVDATPLPPGYFHVDQVTPGPYPVMQGQIVMAEQKIIEIFPCMIFVVRDPPGFLPPFCSWWEIVDPLQWHGVEFHVDGGGGYEFHIDNVVGFTPPLPIPPYNVTAERKIEGIKPCDTFVVTDPALVPAPCSWWEVIYPKGYLGYEFHVDWQMTNGTFHIDNITPGNITFPGGLGIPYPYEVIAEKKIDNIKPCTWLRYTSPSGYHPVLCDWWEVIYPRDVSGFEFHIDEASDTQIHVDAVRGTFPALTVAYEIIVEKKIATISACDWLKIIDPLTWHPDVCSWWKIVAPPEWAGVKFHIDNYQGIDFVYTFHIDQIGTVPPPPSPPPWNVTAEPIAPPLYWKPSFPDYAPSGMPDFDERQQGTYVWNDTIWNTWSHCAPVAVANSLWWFDSRFDPSNLITSYATMPPFWDDHDPRNVPPLVEHLAYLMDTDGRRTNHPLKAHTGTNVNETESGLAQYLSWTGVNPIGDVNGDGVVNATDYNIAVAANNTVPGMGAWNIAADIYPSTLGWPTKSLADNLVNQSDIDLVTANMGKTGKFSESTILAPEFDLVEKEVEKCEDVVLMIGFWTWNGVTWTRQNYSEPYPNTGRNGHAVTVAGVNSSTLKIAISDPAYDAFENGQTPEGYVPVPHIHPAPEPPYTTHNNASFVSHDIYSVANISAIVPVPCPGGKWTLVNYVGWRPTPPNFAVVEAAVITSPLGVHDVAVTNVTSPKTVVCQGFNCSMNVTVANKGDFTETFNVTTFANTTAVAPNRTITLTTGNSTSFIVKWNASGFTKGNYSIKACAWPIPDEANATNNNFTDGWVFVSMIGDLTGGTSNVWDFVPDGTVDGSDLIVVSRCFGSYPSAPPPMIWKANCDLTNDDTIDGSDLIIVSRHFGEKDP